MHFHELACGFVEDDLEHVGGELLACRAAWCDDVACDVLMQASIASCVMVHIWALLQVLQDGPSPGADMALRMLRLAIR